MTFVKAFVTADESAARIRIIDIDMYDKNGKKYNRPSKGFVNDLNAQLELDKEKTKRLVAKEYHLSLESVAFSQ